MVINNFIYILGHCLHYFYFKNNKLQNMTKFRDNTVNLGFESIDDMCRH